MKIDTTQLQRESNGELLRLVCMLFILIHHYIVYGLPVQSSFAVFVSGFVYVAVNCFILLSGFYTIRFKWSGLLKLYLFIVFYNLLFMGLHLYMGDKEFSLALLQRTFLIFSHNGMPWFMKAYMILYCLSPILNAFIDYCSQKSMWLILGLLTFLNIYIGYIYGDYNPSGYNYQQFIYIYMIGAYMKRYYTPERIDTKRWTSFGIWCGMAILWAGLTLVSMNTSVPLWKPWCYNNPVVIVASIAFFCFMMSFHFQSRVINTLAASTLAIYLLQSYKIFAHFRAFIFRFVGEGWPEWSIIAYESAAVVVGALVFGLGCIAVDQVRILFITPIINKVRMLEQ